MLQRIMTAREPETDLRFRKHSFIIAEINTALTKTLANPVC